MRSRGLEAGSSRSQAWYCGGLYGVACGLVGSKPGPPVLRRGTVEVCTVSQMDQMRFMYTEYTFNGCASGELGLSETEMTRMQQRHWAASADTALESSKTLQYRHISLSPCTVPHVAVSPSSKIIKQCQFCSDPSRNCYVALGCINRKYKQKM